MFTTLSNLKSLTVLFFNSAVRLAIKLANFLDSMHVPVLGTQPKYIDEAEDREKFDEMLEKLNIKRPKGKAVWSVKEGIEEANKLEYPLLVRPSYMFFLAVKVWKLQETKSTL